MIALQSAGKQIETSANAKKKEWNRSKRCPKANERKFNNNFKKQYDDQVGQYGDNIEVGCVERKNPSTGSYEPYMNDVYSNPAIAPCDSKNTCEVKVGVPPTGRFMHEHSHAVAYGYENTPSMTEDGDFDRALEFRDRGSFYLYDPVENGGTHYNYSPTGNLQELSCSEEPY